MKHISATLVLGLLATVACKGDGSKALIEDDASFGRRVFRAPPTGEVRALPPHNIHRNGVGPYELSASFQTALALLPNGPQVELLRADGLFDYRLMRADNDALVLGVDRHNHVAFISVLDPDIARTESGVGVGAGVAELVGALGDVRPVEVSAHGAGRDKSIVTFSALPNIRFVVEDAKVVAAVVLPAQPDEESQEPGDNDCQVGSLREREEEVLEVAEFGDKPTSIHWACLNSDLGEAVVHSELSIKVIGMDSAGGPLKLVAKARVPGLDFVAILDTGAERPELYSVSQRHLSLIHI